MNWMATTLNDKCKGIQALKQQCHRGPLDSNQTSLEKKKEAQTLSQGTRGIRSYLKIQLRVSYSFPLGKVGSGEKT